jgi:hypothetical protein
MIVLGADMHKRSHTIAAVAAGTGELAGEQTVEVGKRGFAAALDWARGLGGERVGRWRIAGTSRARLSGSCSSMASGWFASRRG